MNTTPPIACTLSPDDMRRRAAAIRALGDDGLLTVDRSPARAVLHFRDDPATRAGVEAIVAAESECCAFMNFDLTDTEGSIVLTISAPAGGEPAVHALADLFA
jgi:hypothetical protein